MLSTVNYYGKVRTMAIVYKYIRIQRDGTVGRIHACMPLTWVSSLTSQIVPQAQQE